MFNDQHSSKVPAAVEKAEDWNWCTCQGGGLPKGLTEEDRIRDVIATHEKPLTLGACCCYVPYLETKDADGKVIGKTQYVCDWCSKLLFPRRGVGLDSFLNVISCCFVNCVSLCSKV